MKRLDHILRFAGATAVAGTFFAALTIGANQFYFGGVGDTANAYVPPAPEATATSAGGASAGSSSGGAPATGATADLAAGEKVFKACKACHTADKGGKNATGPNLWSVIGRPAASIEGFAYSDGMKARAGQPWDAASLDSFLSGPKDFIPGTKMAFAGVKKAEDRAALIAWLSQQSDTPAPLPAAAGTTADAATTAPATESSAKAAAPAAEAQPGTLFPDLADDAVVTLDPVPYPEGVTYQNPPAPSADEVAAIGARLDALRKEIPTLDYQRARYHPIHFQPQIATASNEECLACHAEILDHKVRAESIAGVKAADSLAWYQTLDTYAQDQADFHWRHMESDYAKKVMNLQCVFCHKGNDPRDETPWLANGKTDPVNPATEFTARKMVNPSETCLLCHGQFPAQNMGLEGKWPDLRADMESPEAPNGCLTCHAETVRTNRHAVTYLNAKTIEEAARADTSDVCYGCHGGRAWYRISYPYPRHPWPMMDTETVPDWAKDRPTESKPEYQLPTKP